MKRLSVFLFLFIFTGLLNAQEEEEVGWVARFGIAGGINPVYLFPNLDAVNVKAKSMGLDEVSNSGMVMWGGGGYAYIMILDNVRLGGIGLSGTTSTSGNVLGNNRQLDYSFGLGGVTVEYTLPFIKSVAVSVGSIIGVGSQSIEAYENSTDYTWDNSFPQPAYSSLSDVPGSYSKIKNTFFTFTPTLNVDVPISRFMALRIGGGYIMNFNDSWKMNNGRDISGVPSSLTENNFFIQTGIYFGFFAF
jgi:hypothetical protein